MRLNLPPTISFPISIRIAPKQGKRCMSDPSAVPRTRLADASNQPDGFENQHCIPVRRTERYCTIGDAVAENPLERRLSKELTMPPFVMSTADGTDSISSMNGCIL